MRKMEDVTSLLVAWQQGDAVALDRLGPYLYDELHRIAAGYMRREIPGGVMQTTSLVNEAYLRLAGGELNFNDRCHFFALAARTMRRVLVDYARQSSASKRGGDMQRMPFDEAAIVGASDSSLIELDIALEKLEGFDARMAKAIELRFFGGMSFEEAAQVLDISVSTLHADVRLAKAWLKRELE